MDMPRKIGFTNLTNPFQRFRSQVGMSQQGLAEQLKLAQSAISNYERGHPPTPEIAKRFVALAKARRVRMSLDEIYSSLGVK